MIIHKSREITNQNEERQRKPYCLCVHGTAYTHAYNATRVQRNTPYSVGTTQTRIYNTIPNTHTVYIVYAQPQASHESAHESARVLWYWYSTSTISSTSTVGIPGVFCIHLIICASRRGKSSKSETRNVQERAGRRGTASCPPNPGAYRCFGVSV